jgi:hypothetical protein
MAGGRVQVAYQGRQEQPQALAPEMIQAQRARFDPNASLGFQLAKALGAVNTEGFGQQATAIAQAKAQEDRAAAERYANSMTVEELGKKIKEGSLLPSQSPTFVAALQHIYGENTQQGFERDTLSKIQTGELKFNSPQEMEQYITDHRNEALSGADPYTTAGYDKGFAPMREKLINANTQVVNQQTVERGIQESADNLGNLYAQTKDPNFKGDRAGSLVARYQLLRKTSLLRDDAAKEALGGLAAQIATDGDQATLNDFLNRKLDNGITVRSVLGDVKSVGLEQHAEAMNDKNNRQRVDVEVRPFLDQSDKGELDEEKFRQWATQNERWVSSPMLHGVINANRAAQERAQRALDKARLLAVAAQSEDNAHQAVTAAVRTGTFSTLPELQVISPTGESKKYDSEKAAQQVIQQDVDQRKLTVEKATELWTTNNVVNPQWQREVQGGASNVASVGWAFDGKNIGQLNQQGQRALDTFMRINATNPGYAQKLVGSEKDYKTMSDIQFLIERGGFPNVSDAAALVNQANRAGIERPDYANITKSVAGAVDSVVNPGFFDSKVSWFKGLFGNDQTNLTSVSSTIRRRAELLVLSGQVPDAGAAVKATVEYLADPKVTTKINNTLYFNKDLPEVPKGESPSGWMERFIKEVPAKLAKDEKLGGDVRLEPNQSGGYTAWIGGVPLHDPSGALITYRKDEVSKWIDTTMKADRYTAIQDKNYELWRDRMRVEWGKDHAKRDLLPGAGQGWLAGFVTRKTYDQFVKDGVADKPFTDLRDIYKQGK